ATGNNGAGGLYGRYGFNSVASLNLNDYNVTATVSGKYCGGLFGVLETSGGLTLSSGVYDSETGNLTETNTKSYSSTNRSVDDGYFGGVIGKLTANALADTVLLQNLKVSPTANASFASYGGVIGIVDSSAYVQVDNVEVNATNADNTESFGGVIGATSSSQGVFADMGNFKLTASNLKGGGIVGTFNNGVLRLSGTTDLSAATITSADNCGQLVGFNNNVLVYALGDGTAGYDSENPNATPVSPTAFNNTANNWRYLRPDGAQVDDLGTWGEVVRIVDDGADKNLEQAGVVTVSSSHGVTLAAAETTDISNTCEFAKTALNMMLNQGDTYGELFSFTTASARSTLMSSSLTIDSDITEIDLAGTGLNCFMRDGGDNIGVFSGSLDGNNKVIKLAAGEAYGLKSNGTEPSATSDEGVGQIYRHNQNGLFSKLGNQVANNSATVSNLKVAGTINVRNMVNEMNIGGVAASNGGNVSLTGVTVGDTADTMSINYHESTDVTGGSSDKGKNIGGLIGFVGENGIIDIKGSTSVGANVNISGYHTNYNNFGGVIGNVAAANFTINAGTENDADNKLTIKANVSASGVTTVGEDSNGGGFIGRIHNTGKYSDRKVNVDNVEFDGCTLANASSKNGGGFLGYSWLNSTVNVNGLTVKSGTIDNRTNNGVIGGNANVGVMCYEATGRWNVDKLTVTAMTMSQGGGTSVGMLVNKAFKGNDGLYLSVLNSGYTLTAATLPSLAKFDELAAYSAKDSNAVIAGGDGVGVVSINMNSERTGTTNSRISTHTVSGTTTTGTGTYQNQLTGITCSQTNKYANPTTRYYYNLDVMGNTDDGENLTLWSVKKYAPTNLKGEFTTTISDSNISGTADLTGLSFYPLAKADGYAIGTLALTFDYSGIYTSAEAIFNTTYNKDDSYVRDPGEANQHYLMHSGLFINSSADSSLTVSGAMSLSGTFLEVGKYKGVFISDTMRGSFSSSSGSIALNGITPKTTGNIAHTDGYLLINNIKRADTTVGIPSLTMHNVSTGEGYANNSTTKTTATVAKSLIGEAEGPGLNMDFKYIKLDGRIANNITGTAEQIAALDTAYNTYNSIFKTSTLLSSIKTDQNAQLIYNYTEAHDWTDGRKVTYGAEVSMTSGCEYPDQEKQYFGSDKYTNPVNQNGGTYTFSGFRPYVATHFTVADPTMLYYRDLKVNVVAKGLTEGCGTYNDPYIISEKSQLINVAAFLQDDTYASTLGRVTLPLKRPASMTSGDRWCTDKTGNDYHGTYTIATSGNGFDKPAGLTSAETWTNDEVQSYLASAYYKVTSNIPIDSSDDYAGLGGTTAGTAFRGVIVGQPTTTTVGEVSTTSYPTITVSGNNPFINVSNGCVVKDLNITVNSDITRSQTGNTHENAYFDYQYTNDKVCKFYGGVIGEIMGGDNIIDNTYVTFGSTKVTLSGTNGTIVPVGGYVGVVVYGGLIFKNMEARKTTLAYSGLNVVYSGTTSTTEGRNLASETYVKKEAGKADQTLKNEEAWAAIYVNPLVGRVINGYAVNETGGNAKDTNGNPVEQFSTSEDGNYHDADNTTRTGAVLHTLKNGKKHYSIADIDKNTAAGHPNADKLNVTAVATSSADGAVSVPNAQALFVLSLITQSCAGTATNADLKAYTNSLSYGTYSNTIYGKNHIAEYDYVGTDDPIVADDPSTNEDETEDVSDFSTLAKFDTADNSDGNAPIPYIVKYYTLGSTEFETVTEPITKTETTYNINGLSLVIKDTRGNNRYLVGTEKKNVQNRDTVLNSTTNINDATEIHFEKCASSDNYYLWIGTVDNKTYLKITNKNGDRGNLELSTSPYEFTVEKYGNGYEFGSTDQDTKKYINYISKNGDYYYGAYKDQSDAGNKLKLYYKDTGVEWTEEVTTVTSTTVDKTYLKSIHNYPARCVTSTEGYYNINLASGVSYQLPDSFRGLGSVGIYDQYSNENEVGKKNQFSIKLNSFDGKNAAIDVDIYLNKYLSDNYFNVLHKGTNQALNTNVTNYAIDAKTEEHGIGLFDSVIPKGTTTDGTSVVIKDFSLSGSVRTAVFSNTYATASQQQYLANNDMLWHSTGGLVGWMPMRCGMNFEGIDLNGISIEGSNYIGGLLAVGAAVTSDIYKITISECSATDISLKMTGARLDASDDHRPFNAMGAFVGKYKEGKVIVYGTAAKDRNSDTSDFSSVSIKKYEFGDTELTYSVSCGGLVGFSGHGFECYDMKVMSSSSLSTPVTIGYQNCGSAGGICALIQPHTTNNDLGIATFKNCTVENINVNGRVAGGIYGGKWKNNWVVQSLTFDKCQVRGNSSVHNTIISNGAAWYGNKLSMCAGGLVGYGVVYKAGNPQNITISDCLVENYDISAPTGYYSGGFIGYADTQNDSATFYIHDSSVENCVLGHEGADKDYCGGAIGGIASKSANKMLGYNIKLDTVTSNNTNRVGAWIGKLSDNKTTIQFTGVGVYGNSFEKNVGEGAAITSFVYADYEGFCESMTSSNAGYSTFNASSETNVAMPRYPYVNINPQSALGSNEIISSDGAVLYSSTVTGFTGTGKNTMAARIYSEKDSSG
ncbi:MAG: hypothetical protein K6F71_11275, partial [Ruminococcus sp.]|nr:hypothetical protein [Ruminococcus sp.]